MWYSFAGTLNSIFIFVSVWGIWSQVEKVWQRKANSRVPAMGVGHATEGETEHATALLSLNQFTVSFLAYWSFFVYGYSIQPFNHFMVWPRLVAVSLVLILLFEMANERKSAASKAVLGTALLVMLLGLCGLLFELLFGRQFIDDGRLISRALIVVITLLLAQGYAHQIKLIVINGSTGAVSIKMSQFILAMDVTTILFALAMGWENGWPLLLLASVSAITKLIIMYLFYWVRTSAVALQRRKNKDGDS